MKKNGKHIDEYNNVFWYKKGKLHREDGPAIIWSSGRKDWYKDGKYHREDGPAVICSDEKNFGGYMIENFLLKNGYNKHLRKEEPLFCFQVMNEKWQMY